MFKKILATIGIGNCKIDTHILTERMTPGQPFDIEVVIVGGDVEQTISGFALELKTMVETTVDDHEIKLPFTLANWDLTENMTLQPGDQWRQTFSLVLPHETPITELELGRHSCQVWLSTNLDIDAGIDSSDKDHLEIYPTTMMARVLSAMTELGFKLRSADVEKGRVRGHSRQSTFDCYQEIEFAHGNQLFSQYNEVEITFLPNAENMEVIIEVDKKFRGDTIKTLMVDNQSVSELCSQIKHIL